MNTKAVCMELDEPHVAGESMHAHPAAEAAHAWMDDDFDQKTEERLAREYPRPSPEEYLEFMRRKVEQANADIAAGRWKTHEQLAAERALWRASLKVSHA